MSHRKKNAGKGFGMLFHGMFSSKADAKKKEHKTRGAFMKRTAGGRWLVMSPRTNPIKRHNREKGPNDKISLKEFRKMLNAHGYGGGAAIRGVTKREAEEYIRKLDETHAKYSDNPHELLVMGANPTNPANPTREFVVPAGATITIRTNPSAATLREEFTGTPAHRITVTSEPHMPAGDYAQLGELLALYLKPLSGGQVQTIKPQPRHRPTVVSDESARQIYFAGGDQDVSDSLTSFGAHERGGLFELGEARRIDYKQRKEHVSDPDVDEWRHEFGEESGIRPTVLFDAKKKRLLLIGGNYRIEKAGIID